MDTTSGFQPYTYYIDGNITNDTTFNLSAGTYSVSVSDDMDVFLIRFGRYY